jgi:hypothetical protein
VVIVALALLLRHYHEIAILLLPLMTILFLLVSAFRGRRQGGTRPKT